MPKKYGTHHDVIVAFVDGDSHPYEGSSVFFENDVLYSWGRHFPLAVRNIDGMIVVNGDKYSVSTSNHQSYVRALLGRKDHFTTSFSAIQSWTHVTVPYALQSKALKIVDYTPDTAEHEEDGFHPSEIPSGAHTETFDGKIVYYHLPASVLLSLQHIGSDKETYALASMDEDQYFVSVLAVNDIPPKNVQDAFDMLKPDVVKYYEKEYGPVPRQGEWFFLDMRMPKGAAKQAYDGMRQEYHLVGHNQGNSHIATRGYPSDEGSHLVSGQIRHPQHKMLKLSTLQDIKIFRAVENTAVVSYSAAGNVD